MGTINFVLQGKGGVGKSFTASLLSQFYLAQGDKPLCIDTDPVNATFAGYQRLDVRRLEIMNGDDIDPRAFDQLIEMILSAPPDAPVVVDNGASSFVPMCSYLIANGVLEVLADAGRDVRFHTVITGGQGFRDTLSGFSSLCCHFPGVPIAVWLNEFLGLIRDNGKVFEQLKIYRDNEERIAALITIPQRRPETFGRDIEEMLKARMTFGEALENSAFTVMARQRLKMVERDLMARIAEARL